MHVRREDTNFRPVLITLDSKFEVQLMRAILDGATASKVSGVLDTWNEPHKTKNISEALDNLYGLLTDAITE